MAGTYIEFDDSTPTSITHDAKFSRGYVPRDLDKHPIEMFSAFPVDQIPLIDEAEVDDRINQQEKDQSSLEHIFNDSGLINLSQNGFGYCWMHSVVQGINVTRLRDHDPYVPLSAIGAAAMVKKGKDEGGWCGEGAVFARDGIPTAATFPQDLGTEKLNDGHHQGQIDSILMQAYKKYVNSPEVAASRLLNKITYDFSDLTRPVYDQNMTRRMLDTCALLNIPVPGDFDWWGHSVLIGRLIGTKKTGYKRRILNSWWIGDKKPWGENGWATLSGQKMVPSQALGILTVSAS